MAQFDVYANSRRGSASIPFLLDIQSDIIDLATRLVVPLIYVHAFGPVITRLNPVVTVKTSELVVSTADIAGLPRRDLGASVANLDSERDHIMAAIDWLLTGV